ncbi:S8 family serine peptidase [Flavisolibacter sp. BT320]|nr:S8 family serine peptidase [Flavisolibacter longurius]
MKKLPLAFGVLSIAILSGCVKEIAPAKEAASESSQSPFQSEASQTAHFDQDDKYVPNQLLVKFRRGASETGRQNALARIAGNVQEHIVTGAMQRVGDNEGIYLIRTPNESLQAVEKMKGLPEIEFAEPNYIYRHIPLAEANDPRYNNPDDNIWGMMGDLTSPLRAKLGSQAGEAWAGIDLSGTANILPAQTGSHDVYVGVIDEGVQYNHEEFIGNGYNNIFVNPGEGTKANKKDDDGNGYVDDFYGWDFAGRNNTIYDGSSDDHGTHVAGTIGARGNNGKGVAGVVWSVKIITAKFLGFNGGTTSNAIKAIDYITDLKTRHGLNIVATNNSWGGGGFSQSLQDAIERANKANILFVAAAGNDGKNIDGSPHYPASYPNANIIAVGSLWLDETKAVSTFSNYGAQSVDLFAPGQRIWSTTPGNTYSNYSGTSMATPHVTGAVALYASALQKEGKPAATAAVIKKAILQAAVPHNQFSGKCLTGSYLDVHSAWQNIVNNPGSY